MNTLWSDTVQSTDCLYTSRSLRFDDRFKQKYVPFFAIPEKSDILEIGCGPGALSEALCRWYPACSVVGLDRDSSFISYASEHIPAARFIEGDATKLPFENESFDVTVSNTVSEHVETSAFFSEQYRVLKKGGVCLLLSARKGIQHRAPCVDEATEFESELWARVSEKCREIDRQNGVCAYPLNEMQLPAVMEKYGFRNVTVNYIALHMTPDCPAYDSEFACRMIESERASAVGCVTYLKNTVPDMVTDKELQTLSNLINEKFDKRLALYKKGEKQWDTCVSLTMLLRGEK